MRSRTTFQKRQKELARQEKQRDKVARREQRKLEKNSPGAPQEEDQEADGPNMAEESGELEPVSHDQHPSE